MSSAHLHLILNHFLPGGILFGMLFLGTGLWLRNVPLMLTGLRLFVVLAILSVPVYFSGEGAEEVLDAIGQKSSLFVDKHHALAVKSFGLLLISGVLAAYALVRISKTKQFFRAAWILFLLSWLNIYLLVVTAYSGGQIRHTEIRP
jgi:hypothetical protein